MVLLTITKFVLWKGGISSWSHGIFHWLSSKPLEQESIFFRKSRFTENKQCSLSDRGPGLSKPFLGIRPCVLSVQPLETRDYSVIYISQMIQQSYGKVQTTLRGELNIRSRLPWGFLNDLSFWGDRPGQWGPELCGSRYCLFFLKWRNHSHM